jgi:hypothetical protein
MLVLTSGAKKRGCATIRNLSFLDFVLSPVLIIYSTPFPLRKIFVSTRISCSND